MKFELISPDEFAKFAATSPYKSFMQTPEIASYREKKGWTPYYFAVRSSSNEILAAAILTARPSFLGKSVFQSPGGPLLDLENAELTQFFFRHLRTYIKSHNGYVLQIDPYYQLIERDRSGVPVPDGFNHEPALKNLRALGFLPTTSTQPKYLFTLSLKNQTPDELISSFKRNTRNHIRKAEKAGVTVRELSREELPVLKQITESTSKRRNFTDKPLSYYEQMYDLFHPKNQVKFLLAEANLDDSAPGQLTPLSAAMFMLYGDEVVYLFSGSDERYMKEYNAQYANQWYMIKYAAKHGFKTYNFYGINGLPDPTSKDYGIYDFKKGFTTPENGQVIELIGSFELPVNLPFYHLHRFLAKLKHH